MGVALLDDIAVPMTEIANIVEEVESIAKKYDLTIGIFGHAGDGNLHPTIVYPHGDEAAGKRALEAFHAIVQAAQKRGGTATGEHGVGSLKVNLVKNELSEDVRELQTGIKKLFDPNILKENNIEIKKKGNQRKNITDISEFKTKVYSSEDFKLGVKCKITGEIFDDINNKSGVLTKHILNHYGDIDIPSNNYQRKKYELENNKRWYEKYFDIIELNKKETRKCGLCNWETEDVLNKTGCFENHIKLKHEISIEN